MINQYSLCLDSLLSEITGLYISKNSLKEMASSVPMRWRIEVLILTLLKLRVNLIPFKAIEYLPTDCSFVQQRCCILQVSVICLPLLKTFKNFYKHNSHYCISYTATLYSLSNLILCIGNKDYYYYYNQQAFSQIDYI